MSSWPIDAQVVLDSLRVRRPVFHSEADFQFAFAQEVNVLYPSVAIRLEVPLTAREYVDVLVVGPDGASVAIELKYLTRRWSGVDNHEAFNLSNHSALDHRRYDVVKDIHRVERFIDGRPGWSGAAITLTNDPGYWLRPRSDMSSNDTQFRVHDGHELQPGPRAWARASASTTSREAPIELRGRYLLSWTDYSTLDQGKGGTFRSLVLPIAQR